MLLSVDLLPFKILAKRFEKRAKTEKSEKEKVPYNSQLTLTIPTTDFLFTIAMIEQKSNTKHLLCRIKNTNLLTCNIELKELYMLKHSISMLESQVVFINCLPHHLSPKSPQIPRQFLRSCYCTILATTFPLISPPNHPSIMVTTPKFRFTTVTGYFQQDDPATDPETFDYVRNWKTPIEPTKRSSNDL